MHEQKYKTRFRIFTAPIKLNIIFISFNFGEKTVERYIFVLCHGLFATFDNGGFPDISFISISDLAYLLLLSIENKFGP